MLLRQRRTTTAASVLAVLLIGTAACDAGEAQLEEEVDVGDNGDNGDD